MKWIILILFSLSSSYSILAQDIDMYHIQQDDLLNVPKLPNQMNFDEFQILSRNLRMKDMLYAMVVPGYVHYKCQDFRTGNRLLILRLTSFSMLTVVGVQTSSKIKDILSLNFNDILNKNQTSTFILANSTITWISLSTILGTYFYDWIHGQYRLQKKQEMIRYKYDLKFNIQKNPDIFNQNRVYPTLGLKITF